MALAILGACLMAAAALVAAGCHGQKPAPRAPADAGPPPPPPVDVALAQARADQKHYLGILAKGATWKAQVTKRYPALFASVHFATRLPMGYDAAKLKAQMENDLAGAGLSLKTFHVKVDKSTVPAGRTIPDTLAPNEPFSWLADEIRRVVEVGLVVTPSDKKRIKRWVNGQWHSGRLVEVTEVNLGGDTSNIDLTTWYLVRKVKVPVRRLKPFDADRALEAAGVDVAAKPHDPKVEEVRKIYREINAKVPKINAAYGWEAKARLFEARYGFFEHALAESQKRTLKDVIR